MAKQVIGIGNSPNDGTGDDLRTAFDKANDNFTELYNASSSTSNLDFSSNSIVSTNTNGNIILDPSGTGTVSSLADFAITGTISSTGIATFSSDVNITGNLVIDGTTTQIDTVSLEVSDPLLVINSNESAANASDAGFIIERGTTANVGLIYDESLDEFSVINTSEIGTTVGNVTITSYANLHAGNIAGTLTTGAQPNITSLTGLSTFIAGNVQVGGSTISDILTNDNFTISTTGTGTLELVANTNVTGTLSATGNISGTLSTSAQPNITSVGTLTTLTVDQITIDGLIISSNQTNANIEFDPSGTGDLVLLSGNLELGAADINSTGNVIVNNITGANITGTLLTAAQPNITSIGSLTSLTMAGDITMTGNDILGGGNIAGTLTTAAQTNITSLGTLDVVNTSGDINGPQITISGNTITTLLTNADIQILPAGTGRVQLDTEIAIDGNSIITLNTNANLALMPAGSGVLQFGTHSGLAGESLSGYITIVDATGVSRKLAVIS